MSITTLPTAPARTDPPATFVTRADAFVAALPVMVSEINAALPFIDAAAAGLPISAASLTFSTTVGGDPGTGGLRFGNASVAASTTITISEQTAGAVSLVNLLDFLDEAKAAAAIEAAVVKIINTKIKSLAAGKMGHGTREVGDLIAAAV